MSFRTKYHSQKAGYLLLDPDSGNIMNSCKRKTCCRRFSRFSQIQEEKAQLFIKNWPGESGVAGAMNGLLIPFAEV